MGMGSCKSSEKRGVGEEAVQGKGPMSQTLKDILNGDRKEGHPMYSGSHPMEQTRKIERFPI